MKGKVKVSVKNKHIHFSFVLERNVTILTGDSGTGKTKLINMIRNYSELGKSSGVTLKCDKPCFVLSGRNWDIELERIQDSIIFVEESTAFLTSYDFAKAIQQSDNYYVLITRESLPQISYNIDSIKRIQKNGKKPIFEKIYNNISVKDISQFPYDAIIVEDSRSGLQFFEKATENHSLECITSNGKSGIINILNKYKNKKLLVIADAAALGSEIKEILKGNLYFLTQNGGNSMKKTTSVIAAVLTFAVLVPDFSQLVNAFETENTKTVSVTSNDENSRISESLKKIMAESPLIPETCTPNAVYGDVDTDGVIDISDLTMISQYMLMDIELNEQQKRNADVNADGEIAVNDMALLKQYILREDVKFGAEKKNTDSTEIKYKDSVKWLGFSYQTDIHDDYINGDSGSVTLVNISERDEYIEKTAGYPGVADFAAEYDEEFFENNVLILKLIYQPQGYGAAFRIDSVGYSSDENILTVDYSNSDIFSQGPAPASVSYVIAAVEVPSEYYHADSVVWRLSGKV